MINFFKSLSRLFLPVEAAIDLSKKHCGFSQDFRSIAEKYGLWNKVEIRKDWHPPQHRFRLFRIIDKEEDRALPLPTDFVEEIREMVFYYHGERTLRILGVPLEFLVVQGMTMEEIKKAQQEWEYYCENFWIGAGG